ncbi:MAG: acyl carrier protein [Acidobacteriota bacterium]|nr:acyl carrier protein [Acidobacteriota bacterium]
MKDPKKEFQKLTENDIFAGIKEILHEVAPLKVVGEVTPESSLVEDFAFDSIDVMQMLMKIQERFLADKAASIDINEFLTGVYSDCDGKPATVKSICQLIAKHA